MNKIQRVDTVLLLVAAMAYSYGQTQVNLGFQSKNVDFSEAPTTKPMKAGTAIPSVCGLGEFFFKTNAPAGQNLYACTATNVWTQLSGGSGGGAGMASQLGDFAVANTSGSVQTLGAACGVSTPCRVRTGAVVFTMTAPVSVTIGGVSTGGTVYWYLTASQVLTAGHSSPATLTCSAGCVIATGINSFPPDATPLWQTTFTANTWDTINPVTMDKRAFLSRNVIATGPGVSSVSDPTTGMQTVSTDPTTVPRYFGGSGPPVLTCTPGRDFYTDTANLNLYFCAAANTWKQAGAPFSNWQSQTAPIAMAGSDIAIYTTALPAGALSAGKCLEMQFGSIHSAGSAALTFKLVLGATAVTLLTSPDGSNWNWHFLWCNNPGATNAQQLTAYPVQMGTGFSALSINEVGTTAIDTTQPVSISVTANGPGTDAETGTFWQMRVIG